MGDPTDDFCPVCAVELTTDDMCSVDVDMGICHAACLAGSPTVSLETGEPIDGQIGVFRYGD